MTEMPAEPADGTAAAVRGHVRVFNEHVFAIAGFYRLHDGRIASAKIYREGSAELGE